tara:strand:+ start:423 stop:1001 length:579 start_codon:yes stop_codon:yes gene_type:complete
MATLNTTNIKHGSSSSNNIVLASDGSTTISNLSGGVGKILQVIQVEKTDTFSSNSDTFVDLTGLSATITPSATSSKVLVQVSLVFGGSNDAYGAGQLVRDSTVLGLAPADGSRTQSTFTLNWVGTSGQHKLSNLGFTYLDSPNTTSATTYKLQGRTYTGDSRYFTINRTYNDDNLAYNQRGTSRIVLMEVAA